MDDDIDRSARVPEPRAAGDCAPALRAVPAAASGAAVVPVLMIPTPRRAPAIEWLDGAA